MPRRTIEFGRWPLLLASLGCLAGCRLSGTDFNRGLVPDATHCRPGASDTASLVEAQLGCHDGQAGAGIRIQWHYYDAGIPLVVADDETRELMSLYIPDGYRGGPSYAAYYSIFVPDMPGKTGCVGILDTSRSSVTVDAAGQQLRYELVFGLKSPMGWRDACHGTRRISGEEHL